MTDKKNKFIIELFKKVLLAYMIFSLLRVSSFPGLLPEGSIWKYIYARSSQLSAVIISLFYFRRRKISSFLLMWIFYTLAGVISSIFNGANFYYAIQSAYPVMAICMLNEMKIKKDREGYLKLFAQLMALLLTINMLILPFSEKLYGEYHYFLGNRNGFLFPCIAGTCLGYLSRKKNNQRREFFWYILIVSTINILWGGSTGGTLAWLIFVGLYLFPVLRKIITKTGFLFSTCLLLIAEVGIILFKVQNYFRFFIENILHKTISFTSRTLLWDQALEKIRNKLFLGYGIVAETSIFPLEQLEKGETVISYYSVHNELLRILYERGFLSLFFLTAIFLLCWLVVRSRIRDKDIYMIAISIYVVIFQMFTEAPGVYTLLLLLSLLYCHADIVEQKEAAYI